MPKFCAWHIAVPIEGRREPQAAILAAGVEAICDCGVIWGVGSIGGRGIVGIGRLTYSMRGVGSKVRGRLRAHV